ncbi:uncharacterized protein F5Z01DRAFT_640484 [Emericellopsis atlantica]|uniref:Uncharacterized protein n=1 Tax=Emericellopsis atlantica TaxID=2614577 RepID=A0A9P7ZEM0_9HYPO|nr:uncharacterized protein F5Z01DRAFT_640484 [Emericellopsis atlantica]KAG9250232.1 hypothetical protein F5Z01DRAFT_640484 [Emericellopsis atlantica]
MAKVESHRKPTPPHTPQALCTPSTTSTSWRETEVYARAAQGDKKRTSKTHPPPTCSEIEDWVKFILPCTGAGPDVHSIADCIVRVVDKIQESESSNHQLRMKVKTFEEIGNSNDKLKEKIRQIEHEKKEDFCLSTKVIMLQHNHTKSEKKMDKEFNTLRERLSTLEKEKEADRVKRQLLVGHNNAVDKQIDTLQKQVSTLVKAKKVVIDKLEAMEVKIGPMNGEMEAIERKLEARYHTACYVHRGHATIQAYLRGSESKYRYIG